MPIGWATIIPHPDPKISRGKMKYNPRQRLAESFLTGTGDTAAIRIHRGNMIAPMIVERLNRAYGLDPASDDFQPMFSIGAPAYVKDRMGNRYAIEYELSVDLSSGIGGILENLEISSEKAKLVDEISIRFLSRDPIEIDLFGHRVRIKDDSIEKTLSGDIDDGRTDIATILSRIHYAAQDLGSKLMEEKHQ